ncbi:MAG: glycosyltransferase family 2 protein [Lachnospiraceae bacterium]
MKPLVSVCIPVYNNEAFIEETVRSILHQTYENIELVVVDDCSKDASVEVLKKISDPRLKIYENEKNLGMSGNWNRCLELVTGEFVKLICADDLLAEDCIEKEVTALIQNPQAVLAESDSHLVDNDGNVHGTYRRYRTNGLSDGKKITKRGILSQDYFGAPLANTFRRSVLEQVKGFDPDFTYILDYDFFMRIACLGQVYIIHEPLNSFRIRHDSNTGVIMRDPVYLEEHKRLFQKAANRGVPINSVEMKIAVLMRRFRSFAVNIYLKLFAK